MSRLDANALRFAAKRQDSQQREAARRQMIAAWKQKQIKHVQVFLSEFWPPMCRDSNEAHALSVDVLVDILAATAVHSPESNVIDKLRSVMNEKGAVFERETRQRRLELQAGAAACYKRLRESAWDVTPPEIDALWLDKARGSDVQLEPNQQIAWDAAQKIAAGVDASDLESEMANLVREIETLAPSPAPSLAPQC